MEPSCIEPEWPGASCIVCATGPSLTPAAAERVRLAWSTGWRIVAVNDAWRLLGFADALYACDSRWWTLHDGARGFAGEKWTTHEAAVGGHVNDKASIADTYQLRCVRGADGEGFSTDRAVLHYGDNSGFQAIGLAILKGALRILLCGFDLRRVGGQAHYFGEHPSGLPTCRDYGRFLPAFERAARALPKGVSIVNCTPCSALTAFPFMPLDEALAPDAAIARRPTWRDP